MEFNKIICGNNVEVLKDFPDNCIDLTVTSPLYDLMRNYKGKVIDEQNGYSFPFEPLAKQLFRVTKDGGVLVWVVNDSVKDDVGKSGNSLRQCMYFRECGFKIHDYMFYEKNGSSFPAVNRYYQTTEFMFILSKGEPKTINILKDRANIWGGSTSWGTKTSRSGSDDLKEQKSYVTPEFGARFNIWRYNTGKGYSTKDDYDHPAIFPESLARDHILSWSRVGDVVLDPFVGSGTTAKMAMLHKRKYIAIDINQGFVDDSIQRVNDHTPIIGDNDNYSDEIFINQLIESEREKIVKKYHKEAKEDFKKESTIDDFISF